MFLKGKKQLREINKMHKCITFYPVPSTILISTAFTNFQYNPFLQIFICHQDCPFTAGPEKATKSSIISPTPDPTLGPTPIKRDLTCERRREKGN